MGNKISCRTIFFDAGMTLIHPAPRFHEGIRLVLNEQGHEVAADDIEREAVESIRHIQDEINSGRRYAVSDEEDRAFWGDIYESLVSRMGLNGDAREVGMKIYEYYQQPHSFTLFDDALPALEALKKSGFRIAIISNFSTNLNDILERRGVKDFFDPLVVSAAEGCMKPDSSIFELALDRAGAARELSVMVGDNPVDDVLGARSAGITPILINRSLRPVDFDALEIGTLLELQEILILADE